MAVHRYHMVGWGGVYNARNYTESVDGGIILYGSFVVVVRYGAAQV